MKLLLRWLAIFLICIPLFLSCKGKSDISKSLRIVQWCDPQLGWAYANHKQNIERTKQTVQLINKIAPDIVLIAGDMIHFPDNDEHINLFLEIISQVKAPIIMTPGNHDIETIAGDERYRPVTKEGLQRYRHFFGDDFQTMECKGYFIISANSTLWYPEGAPSEEINQHDKRLNEALQNAQSKTLPIIVMTHYSPLNETIPEKYLRSLIESKPLVWLSGHNHRPFRDEKEGITFLIGESTSLNDEPFLVGIRLLTINPDQSFEWDFIPLNNDKEISKNKKTEYWEHFIAHAGGAIDGITYTNSLEAMDLSYSKGCRLFELDLVYSTDGKIVANHDPLERTEASFMSKLRCDKYSPMNMESINLWFQNHPDAILVTDKINDPERIFEEFLFPNRVIMELFTWKAVDKAIELGIKPMVSENLIFEKSDDKKHFKKIEKKLLKKKIKYICMSRYGRIKDNEDILKRWKKKGIKNYVFHLESPPPIEGISTEEYVWNYEMDYCYGMYANNLDLLDSLIKNDVHQK